MYIEPTYTHYVGTEQHVRKALFLLLVEPIGERDCNKDTVRALVRKVALRQLGHFMMGRVRIFGKTYSVSGAYGGDGLPMDIDKEHWEKAVPLPEELFNAWSKGGGHNSAGSEAPLMREWALKNLDKLQSK